MTGLAILFATAALAFAIAQWLRVPVIPILLLSGIGASLIAPSHDVRETLGPVVDIGLAFLVFFAGLSLNPRRLRGLMKPILWVAVAQFVATSSLGAAVALAMQFSASSALYLGASLGTSSTLVIVRHLQRSAPAEYKRLVLGVVLAQDLAIIALIAVLGEFDAGAVSAITALAKIALAGGIAFALQRQLPKLASRYKLVDDELLLLGALAFLFLFAGAIAATGLSFVAGAFCAGFALAGFPLAGVIRSVLDSLNTFFLAAFFVALGFSVELYRPQLLLPALALVATLFAVTPMLVTVLAQWKGGLTSRAAITSGLLLSQTSEFSVVMALYGERLGHVTDDVVAIVTIVAVTTMILSTFLTTPLAARSLFRFHPLNVQEPVPAELSGHALMLGYGAAGDYAVKPILNAGIPIVVIEQDRAVVRKLRASGIQAIRGDAGDEKLLKSLAVDKARFVLATLPDPADSLRVVENNPGVPVIVRVFEQGDAEAIKKAGGIPIINALATAETFMLWFEDFASSPELVTAS